MFTKSNCKHTMTEIRVGVPAVSTFVAFMFSKVFNNTTQHIFLLKLIISADFYCGKQCAVQISEYSEWTPERKEIL